MTSKLQELLKAYGIQGKDLNEIVEAIDVAAEKAYEEGLIVGREAGFNDDREEDHWDQ